MMLPFLLLFFTSLLPSTAFVRSSSRRSVPKLFSSRERIRLDSSAPSEEILLQKGGALLEETMGSLSAATKGQLTPYQILHPYLFSSRRTGDDIARPLMAVLDILKLTLEQIGETDMDYVLRHDKDIRVLRIEHVLSHSVDPLCWLHAQESTSGEPAVYFSNAEQTMEAAAYGAATPVHRGPFNDGLMVELSKKLPQDSHVYGGERFDQDSDIDMEWQNFGAGFWMLPMIELRRRRRTSSVSSDRSNKNSRSKTTLAVHIVRSENQTWSDAAQAALSVLSQLSPSVSEAAPPTTLPPIISRDSNYGPDLDSQEMYERGVTAALEQLASTDLEKVVLARRSNLLFDKAAHKLSALDILRKWKFGGNEGGHLFYLRPPTDKNDDGQPQQEFFGCTPEQLFAIGKGKVITEALAGTRPRGSTQEADVALSRDLFDSPKDRSENEITGRFIRGKLQEAVDVGLTKFNGSFEKQNDEDRYFVRRLLHLQHICQRFECDLEQGVTASTAAHFFLRALHPTPAVCGFPADQAKQFIRRKESIGFDRGFYAGPFGYIGSKDAEIVVAIRSGLLTKVAQTAAPTLSVYAGAGIVPGSTVQGEWSETSYKLNVVSSIFPQSPITLLSAATANVAWANAFIEELIRCGVRQFYVCPGSRSTPLVAALARALRANVGVVQAHSVHDERGAAFRAIGYARGTGRPAAVITSSGTATANLYPGIMEAGNDGVPMLIVTADRPYENRDSGANQAVDQVKTFSSTYVRWFRDVPPPSDDVPVSVALSDANHAVKMAIQQRGPVHLNIQFRENLAPDSGSIRNDERVDSISKFNGFRFTDVPNFPRWSKGGDQWRFSSHDFANGNSDASMKEIANMIRHSKRGVIVVGNIRAEPDQNTESQVAAIAHFAQTIGFPIFAGIQSGSLRSRSSAVIPYAEHLLKNSCVSENLQPDLVLQIGHPLISTEIPKMIRESMKASESSENGSTLHHVLIHPHHPAERSDPDFTMTHQISSEIAPFLNSVATELERTCDVASTCSSELTPLVLLGQMLGSRMPSIVEDASNDVIFRLSDGETNGPTLTEPQVILAMSQMMNKYAVQLPLFLSNSMPVRDAEFFLYPESLEALGCIGVNRGASGIDGIISSAAGYAEANDVHTALLIGDLATLHDINSFHGLSKSQSNLSKRSPPVTTVVVNNDGGGIFSFLPIAKHGNDVNFEEFFGTATNTFSFQKGAEAFGLSFESASTAADFQDVFESSILKPESRIIEAKVVNRDVNVQVHMEISRQADAFLTSTLDSAVERERSPQKLPIKVFSSNEAAPTTANANKTLLLLHGWMGDKTEWDEAGLHLAESIPSDWSIVAVDLEGHGEAHNVAPEMKRILKSLNLTRPDPDMLEGNEFAMARSIDALATSVMRSLIKDHAIENISAVAGYSLGGRVAMAMSRLSKSGGNEDGNQLLTADTRLILISSYPGLVGKVTSEILRENSTDRKRRLERDHIIATKLRTRNNRAQLMTSEALAKYEVWSGFLKAWYDAPIWGQLQIRKPDLFGRMLEKRASSLSLRAEELASVLQQCSPGASGTGDWRFSDPSNTLFLAGELDAKYLQIGREWKNTQQDLHFIAVPDAGHALLVEDPSAVAQHISSFLTGEGKGLVGDNRSMSEVLSKRKQQEAAVDAILEETPERNSAPTKVASARTPTVEFIGNSRPASLTYESFAIDMTSHDREEKGVVGIGWGEKAATSESNRMQQREGYILQLVSQDGTTVGVGEVSPLNGLHPESLKEAKEELSYLKSQMEAASRTPAVDPIAILALDGGLSDYIDTLLDIMNIESISASVRSGLEMALISFSSHLVRKPVLNSLSQYAAGKNSAPAVLPLNGLIIRGPSSSSLSTKTTTDKSISYSSLKVKVGHQEAIADAASLSLALQETSKLRPDANRAWGEVDALEFSSALDDLDVNVADRIEFVEEPMQKVEGEWTLRRQLQVLERWHQRSGIKYGLDESIADLVKLHSGDFGAVKAELVEALAEVAGCTALVLKPALLGLELCMRLSRVAHTELGISVVFSCSFDSGVGLAYTAFLAATSDVASGLPQKELLAHGIGTFSMLEGDTLSPTFASYVNEKGILQVASLSRAFFGLGLDEMRGSFPSQLPEEDLSAVKSNDYSASAATSSSGREISVVVSLPLPFSDDVACARFTDLPQQSRWSPWLSSVAYLDAGRETEWTLNVRGVRFSWRAVSTIIENPHKGIRWESISGLKNLGIAEFVSTDTNSCMMKVRMTLVAPRLVTTLFPGASVFLEDFLQDKLLKWSLEMFRDVVKGDLALERGDVELGDALFGAVEGRANAIEATLSNPPMTGDDVNGSRR